MAKIPINIAYVRLPVSHRLCSTLIAVIILMMFYLIIMHPPKVNFFNMDKVRQGKKCYHLTNPSKNITLFEDITEAKVQPETDKAIFFHETSCSYDGRARLLIRQACAIEAAANWNPDSQVFVTFSTPVGFDRTKPMPAILNALSFYPNIMYRNLDLNKYAKGTPAEHFVASDELFLSDFLEKHTASLLRYLTMYKYGGTFIDMDVILKKSLDELVSNCAAAQSRYFIDDAFLHFNTDRRTGRNISEECLREFISSFDPTYQTLNGDLITHVLRKICHCEDVALMNGERCNGFKVYPPIDFNPITWDRWQEYFEPKEADKTVEAVKKCRAIRLWQILSSDYKVMKGSSPTAYGVLAAKNCPKVFWASGEFF